MAEQNFRAPVPESDDLVSVSLDWKSKSTSQSEISQLDGCSLAVDKEVLRFKIAMENAVLV